MAEFMEKINKAVHDSPVGRFFEFDKREATFGGELRGALATFMSMAYILAVNPRILSESGANCGSPDDAGFFDCLEDVKREYVTATAIASMFGCFCMGFLANLPIALAPGMGMNAYFTYSVVGFWGFGKVSYEAAVTGVLIEGIVFLFLAVTGLRVMIIRLIPEPVRLATPAAIGFFLAHLGLQTAEGLGVVVSDIATAVTLGGCPVSDRIPIVAMGSPVTSEAYVCDEDKGVMTSGTMWLGILGGAIIVIMLSYKKRSAFVVGIAFVTFISWFRGTAVTYFTDDPAGDARFDYFKQVVRVEKLDRILAPFTDDLNGVAVALITFFYVDFLDTSGTLFALASSLGYVDETGDFPKSRMAFASDALATIFGSFFGLSPVTSYIESGAGVEAGARTGLTAVLCGFFFFFSIFFAPIIASIPPWAVGASLIIVGALMSRSLGDIQWWNLTHAVTAFLTIIIMPLTYSIAYGLIAGIASYIIMSGTFKILSFAGIPEPTFEAPPPKTVDDSSAEASDEVKKEEEAPVVAPDDEMEEVDA